MSPHGVRARGAPSPLPSSPIALSYTQELVEASRPRVPLPPSHSLRLPSDRSLFLSLTALSYAVRRSSSALETGLRAESPHVRAESPHEASNGHRSQIALRPTTRNGSTSTGAGAATRSKARLSVAALSATATATAAAATLDPRAMIDKQKSGLDFSKSRPSAKEFVDSINTCELSASMWEAPMLLGATKMGWAAALWLCFFVIFNVSYGEAPPTPRIQLRGSARPRCWPRIRIRVPYGDTLHPRALWPPIAHPSTASSTQPSPLLLYCCVPQVAAQMFAINFIGENMLDAPLLDADIASFAAWRLNTAHEHKYSFASGTGRISMARQVSGKETCAFLDHPGPTTHSLAPRTHRPASRRPTPLCRCAAMREA
jgi:hypothetical protein